MTTENYTPGKPGGARAQSMTALGVPPLGPNLGQVVRADSLKVVPHCVGTINALAGGLGE
jgi:hypothetical protein